MRGNIQARGKNTWRLRVDAGTDPTTGKRRQTSKTFHGRRKDAEAELAKMIIAAGGRDADSTVTFRVLVEAWLEQIQAARSPLTYQRYEIAARVHLLPALGDTPVDKITTYDLDRIYTAMQQAGHSPASVRKVHQVALGALAQAVRWRWLRDNPAASTSPPPVPKTKITPPTPKLVHEVFAAVATTDPDFALYVHLAAVTGCRRGELCGLRWRHFDPEHQRLTVERNIISIRGGATIEKATKTDTDRDFRVPPTTVANLAAHKLRTAERLLAVGRKVSDDDFLFPARRNDLDTSQPTRPDVMTHRWARLRAQIPGAEKVRLHDLRHHAATQLVAGGVDIRKVMERLGWVTMATAQRYVHLVAEDDDQAAMVLERALHQG